MRKREPLKSPVREIRTPGSVRGPLGNRRSYRDEMTSRINSGLGDGLGDVVSGHSYLVAARSRRHTCACFAPRRAALGMAAGCTPRTGARDRPGWPRTSTQR